MAKRSSNAFRLVLPHEHGAWAMFAAPLLIGIGVAEKLSAGVLLFALVAAGFFLLRYPLMLAIKSRSPQARADALRWSAICGAITLVSSIALLAVTQLWLLIPLGALGMLLLGIYLWMASRREEMTTLGEWIGIAGLALGAPGAYLVGNGLLDVTALQLYALNLLYFGGTVSYVKFKIREQPKAVAPSADLKSRLWAGRMTIAYHAMVIAIVGILILQGWLPALILIAFALPFCKVMSGVIARPMRLNIPKLGIIEMVFTIVFALVVLVAYYKV
ncbi:MAG: YwiC-like family protein [Chloroflexi bacterium]|nr:YwiC-like family protein [Chloroflexota bacterium]